MDIQMALALIEEYVESLHEWELNNEYNKAIESMFDWLKEYECDGECSIWFWRRRRSR